MALADKNIVITPNIGSSTDYSKIVFSGADANTSPQNITLRVYPNNNGTLSFEGSAGQLLSIANTMSGTVFSANDVSGIPSIEVLDTGLVKLAQYNGQVAVSTGTYNAGSALTVYGGTYLNGYTTATSLITGAAGNTIYSPGNFGTYAQSNYYIRLGNPGSYTNGMFIASTGNVNINTETDQGYKLYVNGTTYLNGNLTVSGTISGSIQNAVNASNINITDVSGTNVQYFPTMVSNNSGYQALDTAAYQLSFYPASGQLLVGSVNASAFSQVTGLFAAQRGRDSAIQLANTGTYAGGAVAIGSSIASGQSLQFYTYSGAVGSESASERMRIHTNGYVGIGTSSPSQLLSLGSNASSVSSGSPNAINLGGTYSSTAGQNPKLYAWQVGNQNIGLGISSNSFDYIVNDAGSAAFSHNWYTNKGSSSTPVNVMTLSPAGYLGIGTTSPLTLLDIRSTNTSSQSPQVSGFTLRTNQGNGMEWHLNHTGNGYVGWVAAARVNNTGSNWGNGYLEFITAGSSGSQNAAVLVLAGTSNVGIGTTTPGSDVTMSNGLEINTTGSTALTIGKSGSRSLALNPSTVTTGDFQIYDKAGGSYNYALYAAYGKVLIGQGGSTQAKFSVLSTSGTGGTVSTWSTGHSTFGPNVTSQTGAALGLAYNTTSDQAEILGLAPGVAWKPLNIFSNGLIVSANSGSEIARFNGTGLGINTSPSYKLDVYTSGTAENIATFRNGTQTLSLGVNTGAGGSFLFEQNAQALRFGTSNNERMRISSGGNVVVGGGGANGISPLTVYRTGTTTYATADASNTAHLTLAGTDALVRLQMGTLDGAPYAGWIQASYDNGGGANGVEPLLLNPGGGNVQVNVTANQGYTFFVNGTTYSSGNLYAPIMYDANNTAYYVDPNSTSNLNNLLVQNLLGTAINYCTAQGWVVSSGSDQTGYYGGNFGQNYSHNAITYDTDPSGRRATVWQGTSDGNGGIGQAGWNKTITGLSGTKSYMSVVYVRRTSSTAGGTFYHGCDGGNTNNLNNTGNGNPYFQAFGIGSLPQNVWCVSIGIIHAYADGTTSTPAVEGSDGAGGGSISGVYRLDTGQQISGGTDYKWSSAGGTQQVHRTYLFYSSNASDVLQWWAPGFYEINGNEPNLDTLVGYVNAGWQRSQFAPYYYDSANTTYYTQPSGTSNLNAFNAITGTIKGTTAFDSTTAFYLINGANDYGRTELIMTGRQQSGNDGWSLSGPRNGILFNQNVAGSGVSVGSVGTNGFTLQYYMAGAQFGLTSASSTSSPIWYTDMTGNVYATASYRAPIYYDSANTSYFVQPSSRSRLSSIDYGNSGYYFAGGDWGWRHNTPYGWIEFGPANSSHAHIYTDRSNFYFNVYDLYTNGNWVLTMNYTQSGIYHGSSDSSVRAYIFYDNANTAYFVQPRGISSLYGLAIRGDANGTDTSNQIFFWGTGNSTTSSIGFKQSGGYFGNPTGSGDGYNTWFIMDTPGRGWVFRQGVGGTNFGTGVNAGWILNTGLAQFNQSTRSPIFYDTDDTSRYMDMNASNTSQIGTLRLNGDWGNAAGSGAFTIRGAYPSMILRATNGSQPVWLLHNDAGSTFYLYNTQSGVDATDWNWKWNINSGGTMIAVGAAQSPIYYDYNNTGYYVDPNGTSIMYYIQANNYIYSSNSVYGTIFYDTNNSGYYADPNGTSNMNYVQASTFGGPTTSGTQLAGYYGGSGNYYNDFYNTAPERFAYVGDIPGATANPGGTWWFQQNMRHTNGSSYWGTQIAWGWEDNANRLAQRNVSGGNWTGWVYYLNSGNYSGYSSFSGAVYGTIYYDADNTGYYTNPAGSTPFNYLANGRVTITADDAGIHVINSEGTGDNVRLGSAWGRPGVYNNPNFCVGSEGIIEFVTGNAQRAYVDSSYNLISNGSVRGTIFYDQNNTGYYCDPNGSSNFYNQTTNIIYFQGVGGNSGNGNQGYAIYQEGGSWTYPYPDLNIGYHTGIKIGGYYGYNGTRFYNNHDWSTQIGSFGDGDNNFRSYYDIIAYASDRRLKENIRPIENAVNKVRSLLGMVFDWKDMVKDLGFEPSNKTEVGVFAQDVEAVLPEAVAVAPFDYDWKKPGQSISGERYLTVKYERLVPLLIQAIKEQQDQLDELHNMIKDLKER
jgi:hypothetical protein